MTAFIDNQRSERRFILSEGALEAYLPTGYKGKDIEKVIRLAAQPDFWTRLPETKVELEQYITTIQSFIE